MKALIPSLQCICSTWEAFSETSQGSGWQDFKCNNPARQQFLCSRAETPNFTCAHCASNIEEKVIDNAPIGTFKEKLSGVNQCCGIGLKLVKQCQEVLPLFFPIRFVPCFVPSISKCSRALCHESSMWEMLTKVSYCILAHKQVAICHRHVNKSLSFPSYRC